MGQQDIVKDIEKGMFDEFADQPQVEQPVTPQTIVKEIDLGEGPVKFEGKDYDEIIAKVAQYKDQVQERMLLANQSAPEAIQPTQLNESALTADQIAAIHLNFNEDPLGWFAAMFEATTGYKLDEVSQALEASTRLEAAMYGESVGTDFVQRHANDYHPCPENADKMARFLQAKQLPPSPQNYDYAFFELKRINALKPIPNQESTGSKPQRTSTGLSSADFSLPSVGSSDSEAAIRDFSKLSPAELEQFLRENASRRR